MNNQPLSHDDAMALMTGSLPPDRPDLVALATVIDEFRDAFAEPAPQPSPELAGWLTGAQPLSLLGIESTATDQTPVRTNALRRRIRAAASALAALGVTAKIVLGGTAAVAAVASAGAVGVLPQAPQAVFDRLLDNNHADMPLAPTPSNGAAETTTGSDGRSDTGSGEQRHTQQRSTKLRTSEPQDRDSDDRSQHATTDPARGGSDPAPGRDETEDSDEAEPERRERPNDQPDHDSDAEEDHESDGEDDGEDHESDDEPDHFDDDSVGEEDRSDVDDSAEDDSSSDASDLDGSTDTSDFAADLDAEMSDG